MTIASPPKSVKPSRSRRRAWRLRVDQARLADLLPAQGEWTDDDYLWLTASTNRFVELADGWIEFIPPPTSRHQAVLGKLTIALHEWLAPHRGVVLFGALRLRLNPRLFREPDLLVLLDPQDPRRGEEYWQGADLLAEVVSPCNADHDLVTKRAEYAAAGIPEYWIVDTEASQITVLSLDGEAYREHGTFVRGEILTSPMLPELTLAVDDVFAAV